MTEWKLERDERLRAQARRQYASDEIEIDRDAEVSISEGVGTHDDGAWVGAWVFVADEGGEQDHG